MPVARPARPHSMRRPQVASVRIEDRVALALERRRPRRIPHQEAVFGQPPPQRGLFHLPLRVRKARHRSDPMLHQRGVPHKYHIRRSAHCRDQPHIRPLLQLPMQLPPLRERHIAARPMQVSRHPRVDHIVHVIPLRGAHQVGRHLEVGRRCQCCGGGQTAVPAAAHNLGFLLSVVESPPAQQASSSGCMGN